MAEDYIALKYEHMNERQKTLLYICLIAFTKQRNFPEFLRTVDRPDKCYFNKFMFYRYMYVTVTKELWNYIRHLYWAMDDLTHIYTKQ